MRDKEKTINYRPTKLNGPRELSVNRKKSNGSGNCG